MIGRFPSTVLRVAARFIGHGVLVVGLGCLHWPAAAGQYDISELMRAIRHLQEQNRALARRVETLEEERARLQPAQQPRSTDSFTQPLIRAPAPKPAPLNRINLVPPKLGPTPPPKPILSTPPMPMPKTERAPPLRRARLLVPPANSVRPPVSRPNPRVIQAQAQPGSADKIKRLEERVKELEDSKTAQEDATRSIIRDSLSTLGGKINEAVTLGGALEVLGSRTTNFKGTTTDKFELSTAELDLEVQVNSWTLGSITLEYVDGTSDPIFNTNTGFDSNVDRINLDTAFLTIGDTQRFPLFLKGGRMVLPFGTSTGVQRADVLSIATPLTIEAFETRKSAIQVGFALPTPALGQTPPGVVVPPVRPLVVNPLFSSVGKILGYDPPPPRPTPPVPVPRTPVDPPIYGSFTLFEGNSDFGSDRSFIDNINGVLGFRTQGHCGRPFSELRNSLVCPWSFDLNVNYNSSIFESGFLETEYQSFLSRIGRVSGVAASVKGVLGPFSYVAEWNGVLDDVRFTDADGKPINMKPEAWQVALGHQFDWNPWVEVIGDQGTFIGIGYSESRDMAGINGASRDGSVPKRRLTLTAGEWVLDGLKLLIEYTRNWDYEPEDGGSGKAVNGVFGSLTYVW